MARGDLRAIRLHHRRRALGDLPHRRMLVDAHPLRRRRAGEAEGVAQGMQVPAAHVDVAAVIGGRADEVAHLFPVERADQVVAVIARHLLGIGAGMGDKARAVAGMDDPLREARLGRVLGRERPGQCHRLLREVPKGVGARLADDLLKLVLVEPLAGSDLAAVASRGAPADAVRVEKHHVIAALRQMQRGREPGEAGADDADVAGERTLGR